MMKKTMNNNRRNINSGTRRKQLLKKLHRKIHMRRQDFQSQLAACDLSNAS